MTVLRGWEGLVYRGSAGSTAATQVTNHRDVKFDVDPQYADTTVAGDGSSPPLETEDVATIKWSCTITMAVDTADASFTAFETAAGAGSAIALRLKNYSSGKGYDGDVNVKQSHSRPMKGEQVVDFTFSPNRRSRAPSFNV